MWPVLDLRFVNYGLQKMDIKARSLQSRKLASSRTRTSTSDLSAWKSCVVSVKNKNNPCLLDVSQFVIPLKTSENNAPKGKSFSRESAFRVGYSANAVSISKLFNKHHSRLSVETRSGSSLRPHKRV